MKHLSGFFLKAFTLLTICQISDAISRYNGDACCSLALSDHAFRPTFNKTGELIPIEKYKCGQQFNTSIQGVPEVFVNYTYCSTRCSGWGLSEWSEPAQWAAPLVQFILPSLIFSMVIPRQQKIELVKLDSIKFHVAHERKLIRWILHLLNPIIFAVKWTLLLPFFFVLDNAIWMIIIFSGAGPMLIGGLYEAAVDSRLIKYMRHPDRALSTQHKINLLTMLVSGNLILDIGEPQVSLAEKLSLVEEHDTNATEDERDTQREMIKTRLLCMMSTQTSFGSAVGAPVVFYLGQFIYTILDLLTKRGDQDAGNSLAFGVEWMVIVHVAIISGCLLASNNPSTSTAIVGFPPDTQQPKQKVATMPDRNGAPTSSLRSFKVWLGIVRETHRVRHLPLFNPVYDTRFQPVWLWNRGINKMRWLENMSHVFSGQLFRDEFKLTTGDWTFRIIIPTIFLIILPPGAGGVVSYKTPPIGFACRSLSFLTYASLQSALGLISLLRYYFEGKGFLKEHPGWRFFFRKTGFTISVILTCGSAFTSIGGTMMQVMGVYRNCFCYVIASEWWKLLWHHQDPGFVINTAVDTENLRQSSQNWVIMGTVATSFMAVACYFGYWYQRSIRKRFVAEVENLFEQVGPRGGYHNIHDRDEGYNNLAHLPEHAASTSSFASMNQPISPGSAVHQVIPSGSSFQEYELDAIGVPPPPISGQHLL